MLYPTALDMLKIESVDDFEHVNPFSIVLALPMVYQLYHRQCHASKSC